MGAEPIAMPGCPLLAFCTASTASIRIAVIALLSALVKRSTTSILLFSAIPANNACRGGRRMIPVSSAVVKSVFPDRPGTANLIMFPLA